ncbi:MAG: DUF3578 domain-containing protein [Oscillospiraceae bacterium]|nr:DUF3578 domain-containing protein [Oscillospiraceae bacterium]
MKQSFQYILNTYNSLGEKTDSKTQTYVELVRKLPNEIKKLFADRDDLEFKGSMGETKRAFYPWVSILNKNVTVTTQKGLYIVFLFKRDMTGFYLSLNQGMTNFEKLYGRDRYINAKKVSDYFRSEIVDSIFSKEPISLGSSKRDKGYGYEHTNIISAYYPYDNYTDEILKNDLFEMMEIYDSIVKHFDTNSYDTVIQRVLMDELDPIIPADDAIEQIRAIVDPDNDLPYGFNRRLSLVEPYADRDNKYSRITTPHSGKIDYAKKAIRDAKTGLLGEEMVMQFEKERLAALGYEEYAEKVRWVSKESDSYGFDVLSFSVTPKGNIKELYIEVKTTTSKVDTAFYVSKNEVDKSKQYSDQYCLYRIYDINSISPKFYITYGSIEENFILDPVSFMARYKKV